MELHEQLGITQKELVKYVAYGVFVSHVKVSEDYMHKRTDRGVFDKSANLLNNAIKLMQERERETL